MFPSESSHIWMFPVYLQFVWLSAVLEIIELIILLSLVRFSVHKYSSKNYPNPSTTKWLASVTARILTWHCPGHAAPVMIRFCPRQCKGYHGTVLDSRCYDSVQYCPRQCKGYLGAVLDSRSYELLQYCPQQCKGYLGAVLDRRRYDSVQYCPRQSKGYLGAVLDNCPRHWKDWLGAVSNILSLLRPKESCTKPAYETIPDSEEFDSAHKYLHACLVQ